jgi:hypothetical protein
MNAKEAGELTENNLKTVVIKPHMDYMFRRIKTFSEKGERECVLTFENHPSTKVRNAVYDELRSLGYKIKFHDDPDPGHPYSTGSYETLVW